MGLPRRTHSRSGFAQGRQWQHRRHKRPPHPWKKVGLHGVALDAFKGWLAVMAAFFIALNFYGAPQAVVINAGILGAIFAMVGHTYPLWLRFQGGKGIATAAGIMLALFPPPVFAFGLLVWLTLFYSTRYVSVASLGAAVALPTGAAGMWALGQGDPLRTSIAGVMCLLAAYLPEQKNALKKKPVPHPESCSKKSASSAVGAGERHSPS